MLRSMTILLSEPATKLNRDLTALVGDVEASRLLSNLSGPTGDLECLGPLLGLAKVKDSRMSREEYKERYGHRGPHEVELSAPRPDEDLEWLEKRLAEFCQTRGDVEELLGKQRAEFEAAWRRFDMRLPKQAEAYHLRLERVALAEKNREAIRSESIRMVQVIRQFLLKVGNVMGIGDNVFFLTMNEIADFISGDRLPLSSIPARRSMHQRYCALPPYPAIIYGRFDPFQWASNPNHRSDIYDARQEKAAIIRNVSTSMIKGYSGASGVVTGFVRKIESVDDCNQVQPGEILVTSITNIGWTPVFPRLAAIVTDIGAPLSHAAIVARELGIPAVVGCGNATMLLDTGDHIRVDGSSGTIEKLSS
jgi:pyruvate,water dikinase